MMMIAVVTSISVTLEDYCYYNMKPVKNIWYWHCVNRLVSHATIQDFQNRNAGKAAILMKHTVMVLSSSSLSSLTTRNLFQESRTC